MTNQTLINNNENEVVWKLKSQVSALEQLLDVHEKTALEQSRKLETKNKELEQEIIEHKKMEKEARESKEKLRTITDTAKDAIIMIDTDGKVSFCNSASEKIFGYTAREIMGKNVHSLLCPQKYFGDMKKGFAKFRETGQGTFIGNTYELSAIRKDGTEFPIELSLSAIRIEGEWHSVGVVRDVSERKKMEQFLLLSDKMAAIGQLAAGVAHEINNPIGFISSNLGTFEKYLSDLTEFVHAESQVIALFKEDESIKELNAKRADLDIDYIIEDVVHLIKESLEGCYRVKKIVMDLKSFSRVDEEDYHSADINECIESTINIVWNELKYKAKLNKELGNIPPTKCNAQQLNQVFMNLLVNASQAIKKQGNILVKTWQENNSILVNISDTGCGIPGNNIQRIFEPFFTTKEVGKGTGLGLSITYDIIKKHNGDITVQSEEGKGTTFTVKIPIVEDE